ncbi:MAG: hypothetical protein K0R84_2776 [Clostridia bacterium]|nr:hypothetical protein [Clostridia bacterium]
MCKKLLSLFVISAIILTGCITSGSKSQISTPIKIEIKPNNEVLQPIKINAKNLDTDESARQLITLYLNSFKAKEVSTNEMIDIYTINEIVIVKNQNDFYQAQADISLKPSYKDSDWIYGGYLIDENGWINNKKVLINIKVDNHLHSIENVEQILVEKNK